MTGCGCGPYLPCARHDEDGEWNPTTREPTMPTERRETLRRENARLRELLAEARRALQGHRIDRRPYAEYAADVMAAIDTALARRLA